MVSRSPKWQTLRQSQALRPTSSAMKLPSASSSRKNSPVRSPASRFRRSSRGCSRSTIRSAPVRPAAGSGIEQHIDADLVIPDKDATLRKGAIAPWARSSSPYYTQTLNALGKHYRFTLDTKWKDLPKKVQDAILYGSGDDEIRFTYDDGLRSYTTKKPFEGVVTNLERRWKETESEWAREEI